MRQPRTKLIDVLVIALLVLLGGSATSHAQPTANASDASGPEGGNVVFDVTLSEPSDQQVTVRVNTSSGTATADVDYNNINTFLDLVFPPQTTLQQVTIPSFQDTTPEGPETFDLNILSVTNGVVGDAVGVGTIVDDEPLPPTVILSDASAAEGSNVVFDVTLSFPFDQQVTVRVNTSGDTATADVDYNNINTFFDVIFPAQSTLQQVTIPTFQDTASEGNELFDLNVLQATNALVVDNVAQGTIIDDEPPPPTVTVLDTSTPEGGNAVFDITLSFATDQQVRVRVNTSGASATADVDFNSINTFFDVIFPPMSTLQQMSVPTFQDIEFEGNETFNLNVLQVINATVADGVGVGTIVDDDPPPPTVTVADVSTGEGDVMTFNVTLSAPSNQQVTVRVDTSSGTATADVDYNNINVPIDLIFPPQTTVQQVNVQTLQDPDIEGDETFNLNVLQATNAIVVDTVAVGTIIDDEVDPAIPTMPPWGLAALIAALAALGCAVLGRGGMGT